MAWVEEGLKSKKPSQEEIAGSPGSCPLKPGKRKGSYGWAAPEKDLHPTDAPRCAARQRC